MRLPLKLALRYVFKPRSRKLTHVISSISMFVIAMVTAAMIIVLSAFNGLETLVSDLFGTLDAELALIPKSGEVLPDSTANVLEQHSAIANYSAVLENEAVISLNGISEVCTVLGVDSEYTKVSSLSDAIISGSWSTNSEVGGCLCLGYGVRSILRLPSDTLMEESVILGAPIRGKKLRQHKENTFRKLPALACGTFSINADLDARYVIAPLDFAKRLFGRLAPMFYLGHQSRVNGLGSSIGEERAYRNWRTTREQPCLR